MPPETELSGRLIHTTKREVLILVVNKTACRKCNAQYKDWSTYSLTAAVFGLFWQLEVVFTVRWRRKIEANYLH